MKKKDLIKAVSIDTGISQKDTESILNSILIQISEELKKGNEINLRDFGVFKLVSKPERQGRNPRTGEEIIIPAKNVVKFNPFKKILNIKWI